MLSGSFGAKLSTEFSTSNKKCQHWEQLLCARALISPTTSGLKFPRAVLSKNVINDLISMINRCVDLQRNPFALRNPTVVEISFVSRFNPFFPLQTRNVSFLNKCHTFLSINSSSDTCRGHSSIH